MCFFFFFLKKSIVQYKYKKYTKKNLPPSCRPTKPQTSLYARKSLTYGALTIFFLAQKLKKKWQSFFFLFLVWAKGPRFPPLCVCVMVAITYITYLTYLCMENVLGGQKDLGEIAGGCPRNGYWVYLFFVFFFFVRVTPGADQIASSLFSQPQPPPAPPNNRCSI